MEHLIPLYLVLCILAGGVSTVVLVLVRKLSGYRPLTWLLVFLLTMGLGIIANLSMFYSSLNLSRQISWPVYLMLLGMIPVSSLQFLAGPLFFHGFLSLPRRKIWDAAVVIPVVLATIFSYTPWNNTWDPVNQQLVLGPLAPVIQGFFLGLIVYALGLGLVFYRRQPDPSHRKRLRNFLLLSLAFLPGFVHDLMYFSGDKTIEFLPVTVIFYPIYYLVFSLGSAFYGVIWLLNHKAGRPELAGGVTGGLSPAALDPRRLTSLGLSEAEARIVPEVAAGLGNKQIAQKLGLSPKTVNNHLYSIYQKLGVGSRWELLARLGRE